MFFKTEPRQNESNPSRMVRETATLVLNVVAVGLSFAAVFGGLLALYCWAGVPAWAICLGIVPMATATYTALDTAFGEDE